MSNVIFIDISRHGIALLRHSMSKHKVVPWTEMDSIQAQEASKISLKVQNIWTNFIFKENVTKTRKSKHSMKACIYSILVYSWIVVCANMEATTRIGMSVFYHCYTQWKDRRLAHCNYSVMQEGIYFVEVRQFNGNIL